MTRWLISYLLNSAWQIPLIAVFTLLLTRVLRRSQPVLQHRIWVASFVFSLLLPFTSLFWHMSKTSKAPNISFSSGTPIRQAATKLEDSRGRSIKVVFPGMAMETRLGEFLLCLYLASVVFGSLRLLFALLRTRHLIKGAVAADLPNSLRHRLIHFYESISADRLTILVSGDLSSPATVSWPHPTLLLPSHFLTSSEVDVFAAINHELAHVKRQDFFLNLVYEIVGISAFYHPALHWIRRRIDVSREIVCDEVAAAMSEGRNEYAKSLVRMVAASHAGNSTVGLALGIFQPRTLEERVVTLLNPQRTFSASRRATQAAIVVCGFLMLSVCVMTFGFGVVSAQSIADTVRTEPEYDILAISHGEGANIAVTQRRDVYIHKWMGSDGKPFIIASHDKQGPTLFQRQSIESRFTAWSGSAVIPSAPVFRSAQEAAPKEVTSSVDSNSTGPSATPQLVQEKGTYLHHWIGQDGKPFVVSNDNPKAPSPSEQLQIERQLKTNVDRLSVDAAALQSASQSLH